MNIKTAAGGIAIFFTDCDGSLATYLLTDRFLETFQLICQAGLCMIATFQCRSSLHKLYARCVLTQRRHP